MCLTGDRPRTVGLGAVNTYDFDGNLKQRLLSGGVLNSPYGLAIAPPGFGPAGGMLIVGNHGTVFWMGECLCLCWGWCQEKGDR